MKKIEKFIYSLIILIQIGYGLVLNLNIDDYKKCEINELYSYIIEPKFIDKQNGGI